VTISYVKVRVKSMDRGHMSVTVVFWGREQVSDVRRSKCSTFVWDKSIEASSVAWRIERSTALTWRWQRLNTVFVVLICVEIWRCLLHGFPADLFGVSRPSAVSFSEFIILLFVSTNVYDNKKGNYENLVDYVIWIVVWFSINVVYG